MPVESGTFRHHGRFQQSCSGTESQISGLNTPPVRVGLGKIQDKATRGKTLPVASQSGQAKPAERQRLAYPGTSLQCYK